MTQTYLVDISDTNTTGVRDTGFYSSKKWIKIRDAVKLRDKMTCQECGEPITGRYIVDHIEPVTMDTVDDFDIAYNLDNLQLLCQACHNYKTFSNRQIAKSRW